MKKLLFILPIALGLFSCKKSANNQPEPEQKKYKVTFNVSDFSEQVTPLSTVKTESTNNLTTMGASVGDTLANYADNLYYAIYGSNGAPLHSTTQASSSATFGSITDQLPQGTYTIFLAACRGTLYISNQITGSVDKAFYYPPVYWNDTFASEFSLTVGTSAVTQSVRLNRVVAGLQVTLQDAIPANAGKITLTVQNGVADLYLNGTPISSGSMSQDFPLAATDVGVKGKTLMMYVANPNVITNVTITAYDNTGAIMQQKTIADVSIIANQKTTLTGTIFPTSSGSTTTGFTVTVNPIWNISSPITFAKKIQ